MKARILNILRSENGRVSGEAISEKLGISRVAVWKHIRKLQDCGYQIRAGAKGYALEASPDTPFSWEFYGREDLIHHFGQVGSTMDVARDMARNGCPHMTVVSADRQKKGRGRLQRPWQSEAGGLYVSIILRPELAPAESPRLGFAAALAVIGTLLDLFGIEAHVKWPNDVLIEDAKVAGILSEMEAEADRVVFVNIGLGLNVNNRPPVIRPPATSLVQVLGRTVSRRDVLAESLDRMEAYLAPGRPERIVEEWKAHTMTLGRVVQIHTHQETIEGKAVEVDEYGALVLELTNGSRKTVHYGDCFHM